MSIVTYPLNGITYDAEDAQTYLCTRTSGLFDTDDDFALTVSDDMEVTISSGQAWIKYADFRGISVCSDSSTVLTVPTASSLDRIDRVVLRFDKTNNLSELVIVEGTAASSPSAPDVEQDELIYELGLYTIAVAASATSIDSSCITDTRADTSVCGKMKDPVTSTSDSSSSTGSASTADTLTTARNIQVDLESTSAASFDGSADITPGVTGTLPYGNGGTGATTLAAALYNLINGRTALTSSGLDSADSIPVLDSSASTGKRVTLENLADYINSGSTASDENVSIVTGTYSGSAATSSSTTQDIYLGSQPTFVWVGVLDEFASDTTVPYWYMYLDGTDAPQYLYSAMTYSGYPAYGNSSGTQVEILSITSDGFTVRNARYGSENTYSYLNLSSHTYFYFAVL